jgi:Na+-translocating ferredoxin:NAD+ oxidoreductase RnfD subunit
VGRLPLGGRPATLGDWSAVVTGLLYGLTLPPGLPLWMVAVGGAISIWIGKSIFGGLGFNRSTRRSSAAPCCRRPFRWR